MRRSLFAFALALLLAASPAAAAVIGTTGSVTELAAPGSTVEGALGSNTELYLFAEQASVTLGSALSVDVAVDGTYNGANLPGAGSGSILAGTNVDSYFIHYDRLNGTGTLSGSVTFDTDILGVIVYSGGLDGSDGLLGAGGTLYPSGDVNRGVDFGQGVVTLSGSTLSLSLREQSSRVDQLRVVVAAASLGVPEPSTAFLLGAGILVLAIARRARR